MNRTPKELLSEYFEEHAQAGNVDIQIIGMRQSLICILKGDSIMIDNEEKSLREKQTKIVITEVEKGIRNEGFNKAFWTIVSTLSFLLVFLIISLFNFMFQNHMFLVILQIIIPYVTWLFIRGYIVFFDISDFLSKKQASTCFVITGIASIIIYGFLLHDLPKEYVIIPIAAILSLLLGTYVSPLWFMEYGLDKEKICRKVNGQLDLKKETVLPSLITSCIIVLYCILGISALVQSCLTVVVIILLLIYYTIKGKRASADSSNNERN